MSQIPNGQLNNPTRGNTPLDGRLRTTVQGVGLGVAGLPTDGSAPGANRAERLAAALGRAAGTTGAIAKTIETQMQGKATVDARNEVAKLRDSIANRELTLREGESVDDGVERLLKERLVNDERAFGKAYKARYRDIMGPILRDSFTDQHRAVQNEAKAAVLSGSVDALGGVASPEQIGEIMDSLPEWVSPAERTSLLFDAARQAADVGDTEQVKMLRAAAGGERDKEFARAELTAERVARSIENDAESEVYDQALEAVNAKINARDIGAARSAATGFNLSETNKARLGAVIDRAEEADRRESFKELSLTMDSIASDPEATGADIEAAIGVASLVYGVTEDEAKAIYNDRAVQQIRAYGVEGDIENAARVANTLQRSDEEGFVAGRDALNTAVSRFNTRAINEYKNEIISGEVERLSAELAKGNIPVEMLTDSTLSYRMDLGGGEFETIKIPRDAVIDAARQQYVAANVPENATQEDIASASMAFTAMSGATDQQLLGLSASLDSDLTQPVSDKQVRIYADLLALAAVSPDLAMRHVSPRARDIFDTARTLSNAGMDPERALREARTMKARGTQLSATPMSSANADAVFKGLKAEPNTGNMAVAGALWRWVRSGQDMTDEAAVVEVNRRLGEEYTEVDGLLYNTVNVPHAAFVAANAQAFKADYARRSGENADDLYVGIEPTGDVVVRGRGGIAVGDMATYKARSINEAVARSGIIDRNRAIEKAGKSRGSLLRFALSVANPIGAAQNVSLRTIREVPTIAVPELDEDAQRVADILDGFRNKAVDDRHAAMSSAAAQGYVR